MDIEWKDGKVTVYQVKSIKRQPVKLLGHDGELQWKQEADGLTITCPESMPFATSVAFKIE